MPGIFLGTGHILTHNLVREHSIQTLMSHKSMENNRFVFEPKVEATKCTRAVAEVSSLRAKSSMKTMRTRVVLK